MTVPETQIPAQRNGFSGWILLKNAFSALTGTLLVSLIGFFITPFLILNLGNDRFGVWILLFSIVAFTELADFGISQGVQRYVAQFVAQEQFGRIKDLANQAFTMVLLIMMGISIPLFILDILLPVIFSVPEAYVTEAQWSMGLLILSVVITVPQSVLNGTIIGYQRYEILHLNWFIYSLLRAAALIGCVFLPNALVAMGCAMLILAAFRFISLILILCHLSKGYRFRLSWPDAQFFTQILPYGSTLFLISICGRVIYTSDTVLLGIMLSASAITFYTIGARWSEALRMVFSAAIQVCFPAFSYLHTLDDKETIRRILMHGSRVAMGFGILSAALLILMASPIVFFWVGPGYEVSATLMRWLGLVGVVTSLSFPFEHYLKAVNQVKLLFQAALFNCIANIVTSIFLISRFGVVGAVWGTLAPLVATTLFMVIPGACRHAGISVGEFVRQLVIPLSLPVLWVLSWGIWFHFHPPALKTLGAVTYWSAIIVGGYMFLWMLLDPIPRKGLRVLARPWLKQAPVRVPDAE